jgi:hypothetical protein
MSAGVDHFVLDLAPQVDYCQGRQGTQKSSRQIQNNPRITGPDELFSISLDCAIPHIDGHGTSYELIWWGVSKIQLW